MIYGKEGLFEAIVGSEWEVDESEGELRQYNKSRDRCLAYKDWGEGFGGVFVTLSLRYLNERGAWSQVFLLECLETEHGESMGLVITAGDGGQNFWDEMFSYASEWQKMGGTAIELPIPDNVVEDRRELLYRVDQLVKLDLDVTASLFVGQLIRGEMGRPILVPAGVFKEDWSYRPAVEFELLARGESDNARREMFRAVARLLYEQQVKIGVE